MKLNTKKIHTWIGGRKLFVAISCAVVLFVGIATAYAYTWSTETVTGATSSESIDMVVQSSTQQDVSWVDASADAYYAEQVSGVWTTYAIEAGALPDTDVPARFGGSSIAIDTGDVPVVTFTSNANGDLWIARDDGTLSNAGDSSSWTYDKLYDTASVAPSMGISSGNVIGVAFTSSADLYYAYEDAGGSTCALANWTCEQIEDSANASAPRLYFNGTTPIVAFTTATTINVAVRDGGGSGNCTYSNQWNCYVVDAAVNTTSAKPVGISMNGSSQIILAYIDNDGTTLMYAVNDGGDATCTHASWSCSAISATTDYGYPVDLAYDSVSSIPFVVASDDTGGEFELLYNSGGWQNDTLGTFGFNDYGALGVSSGYVGAAWYSNTSGGILSYADTTINTAPTLVVNSAAQKTDGSGDVDISLTLDDADNNDTLKVKVEYKAGADCSSGTSDPTLDETDADTTATYGDPKVENDNAYQIGNASGWVTTSSGANTVLLDWNSATDVASADGTYCVKFTPNDGTVDGSAVTTTLTLDNLAPSGGLATFAAVSTAHTTMDMTWGATTETNFDHYEIWYDTVATIGQGTDTETEWDNVDDADLATKTTTDTTITGLTAGTTYYFKMWAYDDYGGILASSEISAATLSLPTLTINSAAQKTNGSGNVDISLTLDDVDNDDTLKVKVEYKAGTDCSSGTSDPTLDETDADTTATYGDPKVENDNEYQLGNASGWITTSSGANTVLLDWNSATDVAAANGTYCIKVTPHDGIAAGTAQTTTLTLDNVAPSGGITTTFTGSSTDYTTVALGFGNATETNFNHYEVWYGTTAGVTQASPAVEWDDSDDTTLATSTTTLTTVTGLTAGTKYYFKIWAIDDYGNYLASSEINVTTLSSSAPSDTTPPAQPTQISATITEANTVKITWTDPTDSDFVSIYIFRAKNGGTMTGDRLANVTRGVKTYTDTDVSSGDTIEYAFKSVDTSNNASRLTSVVSILVPVPAVVATVDVPEDVPEEEQETVAEREALTEEEPESDLTSEDIIDEVAATEEEIIEESTDVVKETTTTIDEKVERTITEKPRAEEEQSSANNILQKSVEKIKEIFFVDNTKKIEVETVVVVEPAAVVEPAESEEVLPEEEQVAREPLTPMVSVETGSFQTFIDLSSSAFTFEDRTIELSESSLTSAGSGDFVALINEIEEKLEAEVEEGLKAAPKEEPKKKGICDSKTEDSDNDGLFDASEKYIYGTNCMVADTDGDGRSDGREILMDETDPSNPNKITKVNLDISSASKNTTFTNSSPLILGTAPAGTKVSVYILDKNGYKIFYGFAEADENNHYVVSGSTLLGDGNYQLYIEDSSGNKSASTSMKIAAKEKKDIKFVSSSPVAAKGKPAVSPVKVKAGKATLEGKLSLPPELKEKKFVQLSAIWRSAVFTSVILADASSGNFKMVSPDELEIGNHEVALYLADGNVKNEVARIPFKVSKKDAAKGGGMNEMTMVALFATAFLIVFVGAMIYVYRPGGVQKA